MPYHGHSPSKDATANPPSRAKPTLASSKWSAQRPNKKGEKKEIFNTCNKISDTQHFLTQLGQSNEYRHNPHSESPTIEPANLQLHF